MADPAWWWQTTLATALGAVSGGAVTITAQFLAARRSQKERRLIRGEEAELEQLQNLRESALAMLSAAQSWRAIEDLKERLMAESHPYGDEEMPKEVISRYVATNAAFQEALRHTLDPVVRRTAEDFLEGVQAMLATRGPDFGWMSISLNAPISIEGAIVARYRTLHGLKGK